MNKEAVVLFGVPLFIVSLFVIGMWLQGTERVSADAPRGSGIKLTLASDKLMQPNESLTTPDLGFPRVLTVCGESEYNLGVEGSIDGKNFFRMGQIGGDEGACAPFPSVSWVRITFPSYKASGGVPPRKATAEVEAIY